MKAGGWRLGVCCCSVCGGEGIELHDRYLRAFCACGSLRIQYFHHTDAFEMKPFYLLVVHIWSEKVK